MPFTFHSHHVSRSPNTSIDHLVPLETISCLIHLIHFDLGFFFVGGQACFLYTPVSPPCVLIVRTQFAFCLLTFLLSLCAPSWYKSSRTKKKVDPPPPPQNSKKKCEQFFSHHSFPTWSGDRGSICNGCMQKEKKKVRVLLCSCVLSHSSSFFFSLTTLSSTNTHQQHQPKDKKNANHFNF